MPYAWMLGMPKKKHNAFWNVMLPLKNILFNITPLTSGCNRPLKMTLEDQVNILVYFHLEEHQSRHPQEDIPDGRPFVSRILAPGETGVMDRYCQRHKSFDEWQAENKHFICRIKASTKKTPLRTNEVQPDSIVFYDAVVLLGTTDARQRQSPDKKFSVTVPTV